MFCQYLFTFSCPGEFNTKVKKLFYQAACSAEPSTIKLDGKIHKKIYVTALNIKTYVQLNLFTR